jgi:hypothetical protein
MRSIDEQNAKGNGGGRGLTAAVILAIAAAGMTMAVSDVSAAFYVAEVLIARDVPPTKLRKSRLPAAMLLPQTDHTRVFTCCESRPMQVGTAWCCDLKAGSKVRGWRCSRNASVTH